MTTAADHQPVRRRRRATVALLVVAALSAALIGAGAGVISESVGDLRTLIARSPVVEPVLGATPKDAPELGNLVPGDSIQRTLEVPTSSLPGLRRGSWPVREAATGLDRDGAPDVDRSGPNGAIGTQQGSGGDELEAGASIGAELEADAPGGAYLPLQVLAFEDEDGDGRLDSGEKVLRADIDAGRPPLSVGDYLAPLSPVLVATARSLQAGSQVITVVVTYPLAKDDPDTRSDESNQNDEQGARSDQRGPRG